MSSMRVGRSSASSILAPRAISLLVACATPLVGGIANRAFGQSQLGAIAGVVTDEQTGKPVASVTVVVNGPALQDFQSELTDGAGRYVITQLPPGDDYTVSFYFGSSDKPRVVRPGIRLSLGKTVTVSSALRLRAGNAEVSVIRESAPNIDTAGAATGVEINQEVLQNTPVRGRTFESVMALAPGAADVAPRKFNTTGVFSPGGDVGVSIGGSTGNENNITIDGVNTTDPNFGIIGTELNQNFIKEVNILSGGYQAEYGRATGGVITITTKSGGNEFHGSVFGSIQPYQLDAPNIGRLGDAIAIRHKTQTLADFGFDLGGYIIKDRIWFYAGFVPTFTTDVYHASYRSQIYDPTTGRAQIDAAFSCPEYLATSQYCLGPAKAALRTQEIDGSGQDLLQIKRLYNWIAKFQFNLSPDHNITLSYLGSPITYETNAFNPNYSVDFEGQRFNRTDQLHDLSMRYLGKLFSRRLQLDVQYALHYQSIDEQPVHADQPLTFFYAGADNPYSLSDFQPGIAPCARQSVMFGGTAGTFNPCPITQYTTGAGIYNTQTLQRHSLTASATAYLHFTDTWNPLRGIHAIKLGFEFENITNDHTVSFSGTDLDPNDPTNPAKGHLIFATTGDGTQGQLYRSFALHGNPSCSNAIPLGDGTAACLLNYFRGLTQTRNYAVYLRDSWQVDWAPGLVLNLGVRWEAQELYGMNAVAGSYDPNNPQLGDKAVTLYNNWSPRIGVVYDFTQRTKQPGRGKIYFNYGRFYESIPTSLNDMTFSGVGVYASPPSSTCPNVGSAGRPLLNLTSPACAYPTGFIGGGIPAAVAPGLSGQYVNEVIVGMQYDVGWNVVLGLGYTHRDLGNIVEDMSPDGGRTFILGNPGTPADPKLVQQLQDDVNRLQAAASANPSDAKLQSDLVTAQGRLGAYSTLGSVFPKAVRNYDALTFTANKRFSNRFSAIVSYTYSRTIGNYPGTYSPSNGQLAANGSSQFDLANLVANTNGPLPTDRPHNFKATGYYVQPVSSKIKLTFGATFTAISGRPIEVFGSHLYYGQNQAWLLPRGSGGRTPTVSQGDLHVGYDQKLGQRVNLSIYADIINLLNQRAVTNVDDTYTYDVVQSIINGKPEDLQHLRRSDGSVPTVNSNYGQPTEYQAPLALRLGAKVSF